MGGGIRKVLGHGCRKMKGRRSPAEAVDRSAGRRERMRMKKELVSTDTEWFGSVSVWGKGQSVC